MSVVATTRGLVFKLGVDGLKVELTRDNLEDADEPKIKIISTLGVWKKVTRWRACHPSRRRNKA